MRLHTLRLMRSVLAALIAAPSLLAAQSTLLTVRGVAFDSLHGTPLADAFVTLSGTGRAKSATSDSAGRFQFDSVAAGAYVVSMQHAAIDSLGFPGMSNRVSVTAANQEVRIAIPSFGTLWRTVCGRSNTPADSGFVHGVVRDAATQKPVAGASIDLTWVDMAMDKDKHISQKRWRNQTRTDASGSYGVCGVPTGIPIRIQALNDTTASGVLDLPTTDAKIRRQDFLLGPATTTGKVLRGTIVGTVTGPGGIPYRDARVTLEEMPEVRSDRDGRFVFRDVPVGTRQIEITSIGMSPVLVAVDVTAKDTALVTAEIRKVASLDPVKVTALARMRDFNRELEDRRKSGFGYMSDSTQMKNIGTIATVFATFPSSTLRRGRVSTDFTVYFPAGINKCVAIVWLDGRRSDWSEVGMLQPQDLALVEAYPNRLTVPFKFMTPGQPCGAIAVWTKYSVAR